MHMALSILYFKLACANTRDCLLTAIANRWIEPPPHTPMRRNARIFHSPTIASVGWARMRRRHYPCKQSKTEETRQLSAPSFKPLPSLSNLFLKGKTTMVVSVPTTTQWHVRIHITTTSSHINVVCQQITERADLIHIYKNEDEIEIN